MRKFLQFAAAGILMMVAVQTAAQTVVTYSNNAPFVGLTVHQKTLYSDWEPIPINPGQAGPNKTWNFSSFIGDEDETIQFIDPSTTPFADEITGTDINLATQSLDEFDEESFAFLNVNTSAMSFRAFGFIEDGEEYFFNFDPSPTMMVFPFAYGNSFDTYSEWTYSFEGFTNLEKSWVTQDADAWGVITTPTGTYNALRVKTTSLDSSFMYMGSTLIYADGYTNISYSWYAPNYVMPVYEIDGDLIDDEYEVYSITYNNGETVGLNNKPTFAVTAYPNPATTDLFIDLNPAENIQSVVLSDLSGRIVFNKTVPVGTTRMQMGVASFPEGMYMLQLISDNRVVGSGKVLIKK
jgi:hypothetical protein